MQTEVSTGERSPREGMSYRESAALPRVEPTTREELRALVRLAVPIALAQLANILLSLTDTAIVGRSNPVSLAGVGLGRSIAFAFASLFLGVAGALDPLASQAMGAGEPRRAYSAFRSALGANVALGPVVLGLTAVAYFAVRASGTPPAVADECLRFLLGHALGAMLFGIFLCARGFLQAHGSTRPLIAAAIAANVVNAPLCWALVNVCGWGAFGAGLSGTLATAVLTGITLRAAFACAPSGPIPEAQRVSIAKVLRLSIPVGLQMFAEIGVFSVVGVLAGRFGAVAASAHQIALSLASFTFMGALGVSAATATRVGIAVGESRAPRRPGLVGIGVGTALMGVSAVVFALVPEPFVRLFTADPAVVRAAVPLVRIAALFQLFDGAQGVAGGALRGIADVHFAFGANVVSHWFIGLPIALYLAFVLGAGVTGLWWGLTAGLISVAIACTARFVARSRGLVSRV
jgi:MATE family multidrug resistance protein